MTKKEFWKAVKETPKFSIVCSILAIIMSIANIILTSKR